MKRGQKKARLPKTSLTKLSNKHLNRLAKQGKLKKHMTKTKYLQLLQEKTGKKKRQTPEEAEAEIEAQQEEEVDIPLEEADYEYFQRPDRDFSFLTEISDEESDTKKRRKRKRDKDDDDDDGLERRFEKAGRGERSGPEMKALLPIKGEDGAIIQRSIEVEDKQHEEAEAEEKTKEPLPALSVAELYAMRHKKINATKQKIAQLAASVLENPENNIGKLRELRLLLDTNDADVAVTVKKLVVVSLMEVFKDIIPSYRIRIATEKEKAQAAKKEIVQLRNFEETLVNNYKIYLEHMDVLMKGKLPKAKDKKLRKLNNTMKSLPQRAMQSIRQLCVKCMGELLVTHPHFNFRTNIITTLIPFIVKKDDQISDMVCQYVKRIFKEDKQGEVSLEIVRLIGRLIKARNFSVPSKVIKTFLSLKIKEVMTEEDKKDTKEVRKQNIRNMSRRDKKRHKKMAELEKELQNASAEDNKKKIRRVHTEIINLVFLTYFRILKQAQDSTLLSDVLEGLAKFAHLINIEFFDDLFAVLNQLVDSGSLSYRESLHCVQTAFTILSGQGAALNIDPIRFYKHLYAHLFKLHAGRSSEELPIALDCLDLTISKRRKQVSHERVVAFIKRLSTLTLQLQGNGVLGALAMTRNLMHADKRSDILLDTEESQGSGVYLAELEDPEHCHASNTALYELHLLKRHYVPAVRTYATHITAGAPSQGPGQLPAQLALKSHNQLFEEFDPSHIPDRMTVPAKKNNNKIQSFGYSSDFVQEEVTSLCNSVLNSCDISNASQSTSATSNHVKKKKHKHKS